MQAASPDDLVLARRAAEGDRVAFDSLCRRHDLALRGFIRSRSRDDPQADEILQNTRIVLWRKISTFDPARGDYRSFARYRAGLCAMQYYRERRDSWMVTTLFSELAERYPDLESEAEIADIVATCEPGSDSGSEVPIEILEAMFRATFAVPHPPHELMAFVLCKLLRIEAGGDQGSIRRARRPGPQRTVPREVVRDFLDRLLGPLAVEVEARYLHESRLPNQVVEQVFSTLHERLKRRLGEILDEPKSREHHAGLLDRIVGETTLREYARSSPEADVSHWWYAVRRRVMSAVAHDPRTRVLLQGWVAPVSLPRPAGRRRQRGGQVRA